MRRSQHALSTVPSAVFSHSRTLPTNGRRSAVCRSHCDPGAHGAQIRLYHARLSAQDFHRSAIATTPSTLLRHLMQLPIPMARAVRVLGIDDFAWKKRFRYGTLLVDLERRKIIEVLPDRESATVEKWLKEHPDVEVVSRDRGKDFRKAATLAAAQAQQVVDRFHLVRNLAETLQVVLGHCRAEIRQAESPSPAPEKAREKNARPLPTVTTWQQRTPPHIEKAHQARQASRDDRYRQMTTLRAQGLTQAEVAEPHAHV